MSAASVAVGMSIGISVLVTLVAWLQVHQAVRRAEEAEAEAGRLASAEAKVARLQALAAKQERLINELTVMPGATVWSEWTGWTGWLAAQTVVDGRRIRVWFN